MTATELAEAFQHEFLAQPEIFSAPGRVNLIGEHTDYNDGFVLPCAIGFYARVAVAARPDRKLVLRSMEFPGGFEFDLSGLPQKKLGQWCDYVLGVAVVLTRAGHSPKGLNMLVHGEVPIGSGLSSSAALEVAAALALLDSGDHKLPLPAVAKLCQKSENEFVGARVGIMDQFVSCLGRAGHALMLDCRSLDFELVPIPENVRLVICNTKVKHELSGGEYNRRREQCEEGVRILSRFYSGVKALRDVTPAQLMSQRDAMPPLIYRRCLHVVQENERVTEAVQALCANNIRRIGALMRDSHVSLRDLYEVSCEELDVMVEAAQALPGFYGGRMTGGGFGGCTVNLVEAGRAEEFGKKVAERYHQRTGIRPDIHICSAADGAGAEMERAAV